MEIMTTAMIIRKFDSRDDGTPDALSLQDEYKKWISVDDLRDFILKLNIECDHVGEYTKRLIKEIGK